MHFLKFRTILNKQVADNYHRWRQLAIGLTRNQVDGDDLLHTVLARVLQCPSLERVLDQGKLRQYVDRAIYLSYHSNTSEFHRQYRKPDRPTDIDLPDTITPPDLGAIITSENINAAIQRLPEIDRILFQLYADTSFNYEEVSIATSIPIQYLRERIHLTAKKIRQHVYCTTNRPSDEVIYLPRV